MPATADAFDIDFLSFCLRFPYFDGDYYFRHAADAAAAAADAVCFRQPLRAAAAAFIDADFTALAMPRERAARQLIIYFDALFRHAIF